MIELIDVTRKYKTGEIDFYALNKVSIHIPAGKLVVILGLSGSGKSTLLNIIGGINRPDSGSVIIDSEDLAKFDERKLSQYHRKTVGFLFMDFSLLSS